MKVRAHQRPRFTISMSIIALIPTLLTGQENEPLQGAIKTAAAQSDRQQYRKVIETLEPFLVELSENSTALELYARAQLNLPVKGNEHIARGRALLNRVYRLDPSNLEVARLLADLQYRTGELKQAEEFARLVLEADPRDEETGLLLARILQDSLRDDLAVQQAERLLVTNPGSMDAIAMVMKAKVHAGATTDEMLEYMTAAAEAGGDRVSVHQLRLIYGQLTDIPMLVEESALKLASEDSSDASQARWIAAELESIGMNSHAYALLEREFMKDGNEEILMPLLYRYHQSGSYDKFFDLVQRAAGVKVNQPDELLILRALAHAERGQIQQAAELLNDLSELHTQRTRMWRPVLSALIAQPRSAKQLLDAAQEATEVYPQSAYLSYYQGLACRSLAEIDRALVAFRKATRLSPRYIAPRIQLAEILADRGDYQTAFVETAVAIQVNPRSGLLYEQALRVISLILGSEDGLTAQQQELGIQTVEMLLSGASDENSRRMLSAIDARLRGQPSIADESILATLQNHSDLRAADLGLLQSIATDPIVRDAVKQRLAAVSGNPVANLLKESIALARLEDEDKAIELVEHARIDDAPMARLDRQLVIARMLSAVESPRAAEAWTDLAETNPDNSRVLQLCIVRPELHDNSELRRQLIDRLRDASGEQSLGWQLADIQLALDEDPTAKNSAAQLLRLVDLQRETPTCEAIYRLLHVVYTRLNQPDQIVAAMQKAIDARVKPAWIAARAAEAALAAGNPTMAISYGTMVTESSERSLKEDLSVARVMLECASYLKAAELLKPHLPESLSDTDQHFALFSAYAMARARAARPDDIGPLCAPLARNSMRWFSLWLDLTRIQQFPAEVAAEWLEQAQSWLNVNSQARRRRLSYAWRSLARRSDLLSAWQNAADALEPIGDDLTPTDEMTLASIHMRLGQPELAENYLNRVAHSSASPELIATALNNLGVLYLRSQRYEQSEAVLRQSQKTSASADAADSLAECLVAQGRSDAAVKLLSSACEDFQSSLQLRLRLADLLVEQEDMTQASKLLLELEHSNDTRWTVSLQQWEAIRQLRARFMQQQQVKSQPVPGA